MMSTFSCPPIIQVQLAVSCPVDLKRAESYIYYNISYMEDCTRCHIQIVRGSSSSSSRLGCDSSSEIVGLKIV